MNTNKVLFWSDLHLGHKNIYKFKSSVNEGERMRPFSLEECEELMVDNYNRTVKNGDIVYFLGDIWFDKNHAQILHRMKKGSKRLVMGNHDRKSDVIKYRDYFQKVYGALYLNKLKAMGCHFPVHPGLLSDNENDENARFIYNIHGHTHEHFIRHENGTIDKRYLNCSVEVVNYTPVTIEQLIEINAKAT